MKSDLEWYRPENLLKQQEKLHQSRGENISENGDFEAYFALKNGYEEADEWLKKHVLITKDAEYYMENFIDEFAFAKKILDVGCGAGHITNVMADKFRANVVGIDIAQDAIAYASEFFTKASFEARAIDGTFKMKEKFDVIHAREFYPFTRSADFKFISEVIFALMNNLTENGKLFVICKSDEKSDKISIMQYLETLKKEPEFSGMDFEVRSVIRIRLIKWMGANFFSRIINKIIDWKTGTGTRVIVFKKR